MLRCRILSTTVRVDGEQAAGCREAVGKTATASLCSAAVKRVRLRTLALANRMK